MSDLERLSLAIRLRRGLAALVVEDAVIFTGARDRHIFRGKHAISVLAPFVERLSGSTTARDIGTELGISDAQLFTLIETLTKRGIIETATTFNQGHSADPDVISYISRSTSAHVDEQCTDEILAALATSTIYVAGDEALAEKLINDLRPCGFGAVVPGSAVLDGPGPLSGRSLAVLLEASDESHGFDEIIVRCRELGIPALRAAAIGDIIELGPCFFNDFTACLDCLHRSRLDAGWCAAARPPSAAVLSLMIGFAGGEALAIAAELPGNRKPQRISRIDTLRWKIEHYLLTRESGCTECNGLTSVAVDPDTELIYAYEESMASAPANVRPRAELTLTTVDGIAKAQLHRPTLRAHPTLKLNDAPIELEGSFGNVVGRPPVLIDALSIGSIARWVAGCRAEYGKMDLRRWAPTGGNMASVELYVARDAGFYGIPGTLFRYDDINHALIAVRRHSIPMKKLLEATDISEHPIDTAFILVAAIDRLSFKYRDFAYRLASFDAGVAATQLSAVCAGYGLSPLFASEWNPRIAEHLRIDPDDRFVTIIAGIMR